jgi:WD40 repeat protein
MKSRIVRLLVILIGSSLAHAQVPRVTTKFKVDPYWPKALPNDWIWGPVGGVCVDAKDHVWIVERTADIKEDAFSWRGDSYGPPVIQYDAQGNYVSSFGNPKVVPKGIHSCVFDRDGNIFISGQDDAVVQKYSPDGKLLMQIGEKLKFDSSDGTIKGKPLNSSHTLLNKTVGMAYDASTGDLYVGDGEGNSRVVVFDKDGKYLRQFGRLATKEESEADAPSVFTKSVHCVAISHDLVYTCDREGKRVEIFDKMGTYKGMMTLPRRRAELPGRAEIYWIAFSPDKAQKYMYVGVPEGLVWTMERETGKPISAFGHHGTMAGQFGLHDMAVDSKGNLFIGEAGGHRVQKFTAVGKD